MEVIQMSHSEYHSQNLVFLSFLTELPNCNHLGTHFEAAELHDTVTALPLYRSINLNDHGSTDQSCQPISSHAVIDETGRNILRAGNGGLTGRWTD